MADSDEPRDESTPDAAGFDEAFVEPGPRRSTYKPPPAYVLPPSFDASVPDEPSDEIAIVGEPSDAEPADVEPADVEPSAIESPGADSADIEPIELESVPLTAPAAPPATDESPASSGEAPSAPASDPFDFSAPVGATGATGVEAPSADPIAEPDATPPVLPSIPERRSLSVEDLTAELTEVASQPGSTLDALEQLEQQLRLRDEEAREYQQWEQSMLSIGTSEALAVVEEVRPTFEEIVTTSIPVQYAPSPDAPSQPAAPVAEVDDSVDLDADGDAELEQPPVESTVPPELVEPPKSPNPFGLPPVAPWAPPVAPAPVEAAPVEGEPEPEASIADVSVVEERADAPVSGSGFSFDDLLASEESDQTGAAEIDTHGHEIDIADGEADVEAPSFVTVPTTSAARAESAALPVTATAFVPESAPFTPEDIGPLPTPAQQRVGRAVRLFWLWFATNSSVVSVAFGAILFSLGMSLRQAVIATLIGVVLSFIPLGLGTLSGKRSGQPTMIVSRAVFGVTGNVVPAIIAVVSRVFWGAALLWVLGASVASALVGAELTGGLSYNKLVILTMGIGFVLALVVAFFGFSVIAKFQLVVSIISVVLIGGVIGLTWSHVDFATALSTPDGSITLVLTGAVLVFSFIGLVWANSSGDLARYQRSGSSTAGSMLWATFGTTLPSFVLIAYGALLAASDPALAAGLLANPVDTIGLLLPLWYPIPLIAAVGLSLLSGVVVSIYSGSFAVSAAGVRMKQTVGVLFVAVLVFAFGWLISTVGTDMVTLFRDLATTIAVPVAAWAGIFAAEMMIRNRHFDAASLLTRGGIYPAVRWINLGALVVISGIGYGLTTATLTGLGWQGYILRLSGISGDLAASDFGVVVALVLGLIVPIAFGVRAIRAQEAAAPSL